MKSDKLSNEIAALERKQSETKNKVAKTALGNKIERLKEELKKLTSTAVAKTALERAQRKIREMSSKEFTQLVKKLAQKAEYKFLKNMTTDEIKRDVMRTAKPVGWRFRGRDNFKKPSKKDIKEGNNVYYEGRTNRSDVSRPIRLAEGGGVGGEWVVYDGDTDQIISLHNSQRSAKQAMNKLWDTGEYNTIGMEIKSEWDKYHKYKKGGGVGEYYSKRVIVEKEKANDFKKLLKEHSMDWDSYDETERYDNIEFGFTKSQMKKIKPFLNDFAIEIEEYSRGGELANGYIITDNAGDFYLGTYGDMGKTLTWVEERERANLYDTYEKANAVAQKKTGARVIPANQYAKGGGVSEIPNNYKDKSAKKVWESWTAIQKAHFLRDHFYTTGKKLPTGNIYAMNWDELPMYMKNEISNHVYAGQYAKGGGVSERDKMYKAEHAGKRISAEGNTYYEYRKDHSDKDRRKRYAEGGEMHRSEEMGMMAHGGSTSSFKYEIYAENTKTGERSTVALVKAYGDIPLMITGLKMGITSSPIKYGFKEIK